MGEMAVFPALLAASTDPHQACPPLFNTAPHAREDRARSGPAAPASSAQLAQVVAPRVDERHDGQELHAPQIRVLVPSRWMAWPSPVTARGWRIWRRCCTSVPVAPPMCCAPTWTHSTLDTRHPQRPPARPAPRAGQRPDRTLYVPRRRLGEDPYRLSPAVRCDWSDFLHLVEHALPTAQPPCPTWSRHSAWSADALRRPALPWAEPHQQEMTTRIIDVAHTVATTARPPAPPRPQQSPPGHRHWPRRRRQRRTAVRDWMRIGTRPTTVRTPHRHHPHPAGQQDAGRLARERNRATHQRPLGKHPTRRRLRL
ncbi:hypothetical protein E4K10_45270 [Streptomyces sp. T1317-0309]|nr:hypothetical protein E4K10_45270 [Streptomyces sp. T1317-0309]